MSRQKLALAGRQESPAFPRSATTEFKAGFRLAGNLNGQPEAAKFEGEKIGGGG
jgi:hypothetical protein